MIFESEIVLRGFHRGEVAIGLRLRTGLLVDVFISFRRGDVDGLADVACIIRCRPHFIEDDTWFLD